MTNPKTLGLPFGCWTLDRLQAYLNEQKTIPIKRSRIDELLQAEGLQWRHQETWFGERVDPAFAEKRGVIETLYTAPPQGSVVVCLDEMGPQAATERPGQATDPHRAEGRGRGRRPSPRRASQAGDRLRPAGQGVHLRRLPPGDRRDVDRPLSKPPPHNWADFLEKAETWMPADIGRVYAVVWTT